MRSRQKGYAGGGRPCVSCSQLSRQMRDWDCCHTFIQPNDLAPADAVIEGRFILRQMRSGAVVHATDAIDLHELTTQHIAGPDLTIFVVLDGVVDFEVDGRPFVAAGRGSAYADADCSALMRKEHTTVMRRGHKGDRTRKVTVSVDEAWLHELADGAGGPQLARFATSHLAHAAWRASPRLLALAEQILNPPDLCPFLKDMYVESRSLEVVAEALGKIGNSVSGPQASGLPTQETLKARTARDYIETHLDLPLSLSDIAREVGLSVTGLQQRFKSAYGTTVVEFLRLRKLERARAALERGETTIGEAAFLAGYTTPANFTTAFRRAFGIPPSAVRR